MANNPTNRKKWALLLLFTITVLISLRIPRTDDDEPFNFSVFLQRDGAVSDLDLGLDYDFYRQSCPQAESIVRSTVSRFYSHHNGVSPAFLRLFFHDCFIKGCDASVFLDDSNGDTNHSIEKHAVPNQTLKGLDQIDIIKEELENTCPGIVSCADTLALATRDGVILAGGPFYPVFTGRRDSTRSYFSEATAEIPKPTDNINQTLHLFSLRGFNERETVSLIGGHSIGNINCSFIQNRLSNFSGTGQPDPTMASDFVGKMRHRCQDRNGTTKEGIVQGSSVSIPSGSKFDAHYYQNLLRGRGLLFSDQQLMANEDTARFVRIYASDDGTTFRRDFARSMVKMSNLGVLTGTHGHIRIKCSLPVIHS